MKQIAAQFTGKHFVPFSMEDEEIAGGYKKNQVVRIKITGVQKPRSYRQLQMFWVICENVSQNMNENPSWATRDHVAQQVKVNLQFIDLNKSIVDAKGVFHPFYRSISYDNLKHMKACNFFDRAYVFLAKTLGNTVDELLGSAAAS